MRGCTWLGDRTEGRDNRVHDGVVIVCNWDSEASVFLFLDIRHSTTLKFWPRFPKHILKYFQLKNLYVYAQSPISGAT